MKFAHIFSFLSLGWVFLLMSCTGEVGSKTDSIKTVQSFKEDIYIQIVSNTTSTQKSCAQTNAVSIQVSIPVGSQAYCRDISRTMPAYQPGLICEAGNEVQAISASSEFVSCKEMVVCGTKATKSEVIA
ncbi:MAG: hypothetical protein AAF203_10795, partial [Pseudomonadota bacterium]